MRNHVMVLFNVIAPVLGLGTAVTALHSTVWPNGPFKASRSTIVDASGLPITFVGVNWPGAGEVMIPEGLQYASIADTVSKVKDLGMNVVRLNYATEMVDDILDNGGDVTLIDALQGALGSENATVVLYQILKHNPAFTANTTRLQVFDAVAAELNAQHIYLILNNHQSKASWCCDPTDGNGWFGDTYFDVTKWKRGLNYMADHSKSWPALTSLALRNELRQVDDPSVNATYGWPVWYDEMTSAAAGMHAANPDALIFFSGLNYDHDLSVITAGEQMSDSDGRIFQISDFEYADKIVFELHTYDNSATNCTYLQSQYYTRGFNALDTSPFSTAKNIAPVLFTEFGFAQNGTDYQSVYAQCLKDFVTGSDRQAEAARIEQKIGWIQWSLSGSYYIRQGTQDFDDWWALLNHNWTNWRNETVLNAYTKPMVEGVLG